MIHGCEQTSFRVRRKCDLISADLSLTLSRTEPFGALLESRETTNDVKANKNNRSRPYMIERFMLFLHLFLHAANPIHSSGVESLCFVAKT